MWRSFIFFRSTLAAGVTFRLISRELRNLSPPSDYVQSENEEVRLKALARYYNVCYLWLLHLSFSGLDSVGVTGGFTE